MNTIDLMNAFKEAVAGSETSVFKRVKTMIKNLQKMIPYLFRFIMTLSMKRASDPLLRIWNITLRKRK